MKRTSRRSSRNQSGRTAPAGQQRRHCPVVRVRQRWREMSTPGLPTNLAFLVQREIGTPAYSSTSSTEVSRAGTVMRQGHPRSGNLQPDREPWRLLGWRLVITNIPSSHNNHCPVIGRIVSVLSEPQQTCTRVVAVLSLP